MRSFLIGLVILLPVFILSYFVYNPSERQALALDKQRQSTIGAMARGLEPFFKKDGVYPESLEVLESLPSDVQNYTYKVSESGESFILYSKASSLTWQQFCREQSAQILYSTEGAKTGVVCADNPAPGPQDFMN